MSTKESTDKLNTAIVITAVGAFLLLINIGLGFCVTAFGLATMKVVKDELERASVPRGEHHG